MTGTFTALIMVGSGLTAILASIVAPIIFVVGLVLLFFSRKWAIRAMLGAVGIVAVPLAISVGTFGLRSAAALLEGNPEAKQVEVQKQEAPLKAPSKVTSRSSLDDVEQLLAKKK